MGVPTFASISTKRNENEQGEELTINALAAPTIKRGLEGALNHGPAFIVDNVLSQQVCEQMIADAEQLQFGNFNSGKNNHGALQLLVSQKLVDDVAQQLAPHININQVEALRNEMIRGTTTHHNPSEGEDVRLFFKGLNRRWRVYRYDASGKESFAPHIDAGFPPSGLSEDETSLIWDGSDPNGPETVSRLTVLIYLNDDFVGGETNFYRPVSAPSVDNDQFPPLVASVRPVAGSVLVFPQGVGEEAVEYARQHWPLHEGSPVLSGRPKYVIRSDAIFVTQRENLLLDNELFRYDHLVRDAFLPKATTFHPEFLSHVISLYNPHMGVENVGPFLYNFIRVTKKRQIVEIGAGYSTLWILQALRDNDEELRQIQSLQETGRCKLLDIEWSIESIVDDLRKKPVLLLCVDNCEHQKETASGASSVAKALNLDSYFEFVKGDAFDLDLGVETVDVLWADFGVGAKCREFMLSAWSCIRPGGFLLCHSTLTNANTRQWLEGIRTRQPKEVTGIDPAEYVELSLLEPHKRYQNSVSIIQKRKSRSGEVFQEPIYSQYA
jgi:hypothetical protein